MAYKTLSKKGKNRAWVAAHPHLAVTVANLRGQAGMSEDAIYHTMKREVAKNVAPSIRDIRAAWEEFQVEHLRIAGEKGRRIAFKDRAIEEGGSRYLERRKDQFSAKQVDDLNRKLVVGYLIHAETPVAEWADPVAFAGWEEGDPFNPTPPF